MEKNISIPNTKIAEVIGVTESSVRKAKRNFQMGKSKRYLDYLEAFQKGMNIKDYDALKMQEEINKINELYKNNDKSSNSNIIALVNFKGGVGKSTIAMLLQEYLPDSVIVNIDYQEAENINPDETTIDFQVLKEQEEGLTLKEFIEAVTDPNDKDTGSYFKNVIIDTQGTEFNEDFDSILKDVTHFVIPMTPGKRTRDKTKMTIETLLDFGANPNAKWCIIINKYIDDKQLEEEIEYINKEIKPILKDKLVCISDLKYSKMVSRMENNKMDLKKLSLKEKAQVKVFKKRVEQLNQDLANKLFNEK
jgi:cellulose biosynthesis protein BcsQ